MALKDVLPQSVYSFSSQLNIQSVYLLGVGKKTATSRFIQCFAVVGGEAPCPRVVRAHLFAHRENSFYSLAKLQL
jgi:hypothetical protein